MILKTARKGYLLLEDGTIFHGESLSGPAPAFGEAVFNTSHTGYQEILTDPSYHRQIMTFTCPHIGNVGVNSEDNESVKIYTSGAVMRNLSPQSRNWRSERNLANWMVECNIPFLTGVNTRGVTLHLRARGAMRAGIFSSDTSQEDALKMVRGSISISGR
jgi:carbamoyl-phosphate synthase small subunit